MYQVAYHPWSTKCIGSNDIEITKRDFISRVYSDSSFIINQTNAARWILVTILIFKIMIIVLMYWYPKWLLRTRFVTFVLEIVCIILLSNLYVASDNDLVIELAQHNCTFDPILQANLIQIANFKQKVVERTSTCLAYMGIVLILEIGGIIYRISQDCYTKYQENKYTKMKTFKSGYKDFGDTDSESKYISFQIK